MTMGVEPISTMGVAPVIGMGSGFSIHTISTADPTRWRVDILCIGIDRVVDYIVGTAATTNPQTPATPANHVLIATILVPPGVTEIEQTFIYRGWQTPVVSRITATATPSTLTWADATADIAIRVLDQYGIDIAGSYLILSEILDGSGTITVPRLSRPLELQYNRVTDHDVFPYPEENCPVLIRFSLADRPEYTTEIFLLLEDLSGALIV
jgi:hypothetical protein